MDGDAIHRIALECAKKYSLSNNFSGKGRLYLIYVGGHSDARAAYNKFPYNKVDAKEMSVPIAEYENENQPTPTPHAQYSRLFAGEKETGGDGVIFTSVMMTTPQPLL